MWTGDPCRIKFKSSSEYNMVFNYTMYYLMALMMNGSEFSKNLENNQINSWLKRNAMVLDITMIGI